MKTQNIFDCTKIVLDTENGFAYAADANDENLFQVCLMQRKDGKGYRKAIKANDSGYNEGLCGDYNASIKADTPEHLKDFLKHARKCGLKVV